MAIIDVIKYEGGNDTFVYKHESEDFNTGTQLIVHESQEAVFFRDGKAMDRFGAGKYTLDTESLPLMKRFFKAIVGGLLNFMQKFISSILLPLWESSGEQILR